MGAELHRSSGRWPAAPGPGDGSPSQLRPAPGAAGAGRSERDLRGPEANNGHTNGSTNGHEALGRKPQRALRGSGLTLPETGRSHSARPPGGGGLGASQLHGSGALGGPSVAGVGGLEPGQDVQAPAVRATRRSRPGADSHMFPLTATRRHEPCPEGGGEAAAQALHASRISPGWWSLEPNESPPAEGLEQHGGGRRLCSPAAGASRGSRPPVLVEARSPKRSPAHARPSWPAMPQKGPATCELCCFCFQVLLAHLQSQPPPSFPSLVDPFFKAPLFVTWMKRRKGKHGGSADLELRGCIGCLEPVALCPGLSEYALRSALQDKRFPPIQLEELPSLTCKLSILYQFEPSLHVYDWQVGVHGVLINFLDAHGRRYSATYLPEVPREHSMSRDVAIRELVVKSGYPGPCGEDLLARMQVTRYQTLVEGIAYWEYLCLIGSEAAVPGCPGA